MAKSQNTNVSDETVSQVGKAVVEIMKIRQVMEESMTAAQTEEERQNLAEQVEIAAVQAIGEQGLTVDEYNEVITAAQADPDLEERVLTACRSA